jgi:hypothetical protein
VIDIACGNAATIAAIAAGSIASATANRPGLAATAAAALDAIGISSGAIPMISTTLSG